MSVQVTLFGYPHLAVDHEIVHLGRSKALALLAYLVTNQKIYRRESLASIFWADYDDRGALAELRRHLSSLKKAIPSHYFQITRDTIGIQRAEDFSDDVSNFQSLLADCYHHAHEAGSYCDICVERLYQATRQYQGEFMAGFSLPDSPEFAHWQRQQAFILSEKMVNALEILAHYEQQAGKFSEAITTLQKLLSINLLHEPAHQRLMQLYTQKGQRGQALAQYEQCRRALDHELGVQVSEVTRHLYQQIRDEQYQVSITTPMPLPSSLSRNIPLPVTSTIGREAELHLAFERLQDPSCRLLSIVGLGGIGKTHFVLELLHRYFGDEEGVFYVPLVARSPEQLASAIAEQVSFRAYSSDPLTTQLRDYLGNKSYLIVLDNFEHMLDEVAFLENILQAAPKIRFVVTSRRRLALPAEWLVELRELAYPDDEAQDPAAYAACSLFVQVAERVNPYFKVDMPSIAMICRLLHGLPLAIEWVAVRTRIQSLATIQQQLQSDLAQMLTSEIEIDRVFTQSWDLLSVEQQTALQALAIFPADFSVDAASHVAVLDIMMLMALRDHSLLSYDVQTERFKLHPILRSQLLERHPPSISQKIAFAMYYATWLKQIELQIVQRDLVYLQRVEDEIDNIRLALQFAITHQQFLALDQALVGVYRFFELKKYLQEGRQIFHQIVTSLEDYIDKELNDIQLARWLLVKATARQAGFAFAQGDYATSRDMLEQYLPFLRDNENKQELSFVLNNLGMVYGALGDLEQAEGLLLECLELREAMQDLSQMARTMNNLGIVARRRGEPEQARQQHYQALALYTHLNDYVGIALSCNNLGNIAYKLGDYEQARHYQERCLKLRQKFGLESSWNTACTLHNLGLSQQQLHEYSKAKDLIYIAYSHFKEIGHAPRLHFSLLDLAHLAHELGQNLEAQRYLLEALQNAQVTQQSPQLAEILWLYVPILIQQGEARLAQQMIRALLHESPPNIQAEVRAYLTSQQLALDESSIPLNSLKQLALEIQFKQLIGV